MEKKNCYHSLNLRILVRQQLSNNAVDIAARGSSLNCLRALHLIDTQGRL